MTMSKLEMLSPENHAIALVDYQPAMYQGVQSHDRLVTFIKLRKIVAIQAHA
jgi:hypothetical protein